MYNLFKPELIYIAIVAALAFYGAVFALALVISIFSTGTFGVAMLVLIMFAYVIQIPFSVLIDKYMFKKA